MGKTASAALGIQAILTDLGVSLPIQLHTDAAAAKGIAMRTGLGKARHLETSQLVSDFVFKSSASGGRGEGGGGFIALCASLLISKHPSLLITICVQVFSIKIEILLNFTLAF